MRSTGAGTLPPNPSLVELIRTALRDDFSKRPNRSFYRSMLRVKVKALDAKLGKRSFGDKDEWHTTSGRVGPVATLASHVRSLVVLVWVGNVLDPGALLL